MAKIEQGMVIQAPEEQVFSYLADLSRHSEWGNTDHRLQIEKTSEGPVGQGSTFRSVGHQFGQNEDLLTITEHAPNQRLAFESDGKAGLIRHAFEITPAEGGVRVTKSFEAVTSKLPFSLFLPIVRMFVLPGALQGDLQSIKERLEGQPSG